jgi:hypothetical protein
MEKLVREGSIYKTMNESDFGICATENGQASRVHVSPFGAVALRIVAQPWRSLR